MTAAEILDGLLRVNLAAGAAILGVIVLRGLVRRPFGARLAYGLWLLPVLAGAAVLAPPRQVVVVQAAPVLRPASVVRIPAAARVQFPLALAQASPVQPTVSGPASAPAISLAPRVMLLALWLAGAGGAALVMAGLQHRFMRQARRGAVGPAVVGVIAPRIVTPRDFGDRYSRDEQALVLAHEQAHIARQDSRLNGLCAAVQCLCWFNPLVHLAARLMRVDQELACDEAVVTRFPAARRAYAEVLLKAQLAILPLPLGCYWPSSARHPLVERVALLKLRVVSPARRWAGAAALTLLCAGAGLAAWASQPADVRIRIARPAPNGQAAQLAPVAAVAAAASETSAVGDGGAAQTPVGVAAAPVTVAGGDGSADQTPAATAAPPKADYASGVGPLDVTGDQLQVNDQHYLATWRGNVELVFGGNHLLSDVLNLYFSGKPADGTAARQVEPEGGPQQIGPDWGPPQKVVAEGHVTFVTANQTVKADLASYNPATGTVILSGNVVEDGKDVGAEKLLIDLKTGATPGAEANAGAPVPLQAVSPEPVRARPLAFQMGQVTVRAAASPAEVRTQTKSFVKSFAAATAGIDQIARWRDPICVDVNGLAPEAAAQVKARVEAVAKAVRRGVLQHGCRSNVEIVFTDEPQRLLDDVAARRERVLGYHYQPSLRALKTVTRPIQAWYVTSTLGGGGHTGGILFSGFGFAPPMQVWDRVVDDPDNLPPTGCGDSRFSACLQSVFDHVLVVVDSGRVRDKSVGLVSDYVAMLALSQPRSFDGCNALPSVIDLFAPACPGREAPDGLTPADAAYLTSLYATDPEAKRAGQQSDIAWRMAKILTAANVVAR